MANCKTRQQTVNLILHRKTLRPGQPREGVTASKEQNGFEAKEDFVKLNHLFPKWKHLEKLPYPEEYKKMTERFSLK